MNIDINLMLTITAGILLASILKIVVVALYTLFNDRTSLHIKIGGLDYDGRSSFDMSSK